MSTSRHDTLHLLRRWQSGDQRALDALITRHLPWIAAQVRRQVGVQLRARAETQDLVHDAVIEVMRDGPRFEVSDEHAFRGLLARIVANTLRDRARFEGRQRRSAGREWGGVADTVLSLDTPGTAGQRPSQAAARDEEVAWVRLALELLAPEDRDVIWLREFEELEFAQVGARLGTGADAARMRFHRALPRLASRVAQLRSGAVRQALTEADGG